MNSLRKTKTFCVLTEFIELPPSFAISVANNYTTVLLGSTDFFFFKVGQEQVIARDRKSDVRKDYGFSMSTFFTQLDKYQRQKIMRRVLMTG